MYLLLLIEFIAFPAKDDSIFEHIQNKEDIITDSSGSLGFFYKSKCHLSHPNSTTSNSNRDEWCSNIVDKNSNSKPWISFQIKNKKMRIHGYSLRNGCCYHSCCCDENGKIIDYYCCCDIYSFSLQGSNDKKNWKTIHKIEKKRDFYHCKFETYEFETTEPFIYLRIVNDEPYPGCTFCMMINQVEFYGKTIPSFDNDFYENDAENDESVSIIGKIKHE